MSSSNGQQQPDQSALKRQEEDSPMVDEMLYDSQMMDVAGQEDSSSAPAMNGSAPTYNLMSDLASNDRVVHAGFYNNFGDLFDDKDVE